MSAAPFLLPIEPKTAIAKFLVDMRLQSDRAWRRWNRAMVEVLTEVGLAPQERKFILDLIPAEDFFFGALVGLQAYRVRELFPFNTAEALLKELALQVDGAVGRDDNRVSSLVFITFGRIRKARAADDFCDHDQVMEALLERLGIQKDARTQTIMTNLRLRHALAEPLALAAPNWWEAFTGLYLVRTKTLEERVLEDGKFGSHAREGFVSARSHPRRSSGSPTLVGPDRPARAPQGSPLSAWLTRPPAPDWSRPKEK